MTRVCRLELDVNGAPLLSVFGGKITTFRKLAEEAVDMPSTLLSTRRGAWTADACLPGGALFGAKPSNRSVLEFEKFAHDLQERYAFLPPDLVTRYARTYGTRVDKLLAGRKREADMGEQIAPGLYEAEADYLMQHEWAADAADILWRRTKLGLHLPGDTQDKLDAWMRTRNRIEQSRSA